MKPLCIDLFCGLFGWGSAFASEGYSVVGFDIARVGRAVPDGCQLVLQDVLTLHGSQFRNAAVIVASPPCTEYSYMAMPWSRAKQIGRALRGDDVFPEDYTGSRTMGALNALFDACFRIQREATEAAGRYIPLVVENVRGCQPWTRASKANFGSFYLWGDINSVGRALVAGKVRFGEVLRTSGTRHKHNPDGSQNGQGSWFKIADSKNRGRKNDGGSWFAIGSPGQTNVGQNPDGRKTGHPERSFRNGHKSTAHLTCQAEHGVKVSGDWFGSYAEQKEAGTISPGRLHGKGSAKLAQASAEIAKIPFPLAQHVARVFKPV